VSNSLAEGTQEQRPLPDILVNDRPLRVVGQQALAAVAKQNDSRTPQGSYNTGGYYRPRTPGERSTCTKSTKRAAALALAANSAEDWARCRAAAEMTTDDDLPLNHLVAQSDPIRLEYEDDREDFCRIVETVFDPDMGEKRLRSSRATYASGVRRRAKGGGTSSAH
jgi:hypothetical protein